MILLDTSGLLASLLPDQRHHRAAARSLLGDPGPFPLSPFVLAEMDYLLTKWVGIDAELLFLEEVARGAYRLESFDEGDVERARRIVERYRDLDLGLADASILVLAERLDCWNLLSLDERHFRALQGPAHQSFRILPADQDPSR